MENTYWPFFVSANRQIDYRTFVAPDFIADQGLSNILARATKGELSAPGTAYFRVVNFPKSDKITLVYRIIQATGENTGVDIKGNLKDSFGREIFIIEGFVFYGKNDQVILTQNHFDQLHDEIKKYYPDFWHLEDPNLFKVETSSSCTLDSPKNSETPLKYEQFEPYMEEFYANTSDVRLSSNNLKLDPFEMLNCHGEISSMVISPDGNLLFIRCEHKIVRFDLLSQQSRDFFAGSIAFQTYPTPVAIDRKGKFLVSAFLSDFKGIVVKRWELNNENKPPKDLGEYGSILERGLNLFKAFQEGNVSTGIKAVAFTPNSQTVILGGTDGKIKLWDSQLERMQHGELSDVNVLPSEVRCFTVYPNDELLLASGHANGVINVWNLLTKKVEYSQKCSSGVNSLVVTPNGQMLIGGHEKGEVSFWEPEKSSKCSFIEAHSGSVNAVAINQKGRLLATAADDDNLIKIWSLNNKQVIGEFQGNSAITSLVFTPDNNFLISGNQEGELQRFAME